MHGTLSSPHGAVSIPGRAIEFAQDRTGQAGLIHVTNMINDYGVGLRGTRPPQQRKPMAPSRRPKSQLKPGARGCHIAVSRLSARGPVVRSAIVGRVRPRYSRAEE